MTTAGFKFAKPVRPEKERKPLRRGKPLRAKRWGIKPRRPRRLDKPQSDPARLEWVRGETCAVWWRVSRRYPCEGRTEACHEGPKPGMSMKCDDAQTMPMCTAHHRQWTDHVGMFKGWSKERRRAWADERIAETTARYLSHGGRRGS